MAKSLVEFFSKTKTKELIEKFKNAGVNIEGKKSDALSTKLENKNIVVTGTFDNYTRDDIVKLIEQNSGKFVSSVSKKTDFVIAGEQAGSKLNKANDLGIKVITINDFLNMINS